uniref:AAA domain-containing protein n=1 Tax=Angiostrongylus cantonensis TaxID=6313 RepID=A0A0K0D626_ANGCA
MDSFVANSKEDKHSSASERMNAPWVEKYRPRNVDEVVYHSEIVLVLKKVLDGADLPNILLYGPPGTGKTSAVMAFCRELFPVHKVFCDRILELNASDERGIQVVRTRVCCLSLNIFLSFPTIWSFVVFQIKEFAHRAVPKGRIPFKIVILDEVDAMTGAAQAALRRIIEKYSKTTRFFLICNYVSRIIDPLTSRCAKFRFKPLPLECQKDRLLYICKNEGIDISDDTLSMLITFCEGDLRRSINYLQSLSFRQNITSDFIFSTTGQVPEKDIHEVILACHSSDATRLLGAVDYLHRCGYSARLVIDRLFDHLLDDDALADIDKSAIFDKMAVCPPLFELFGAELIKFIVTFVCVKRSFLK